MRAVFLFLIIFGIASLAIFGYRYVTKNDVKVVGKLTFAGVIALVVSVIIYLGEVG